MGQKDTTEKLLMDYNDVFADIVNGLLCKGEQVVQPRDLVVSQPISQYKADGRIHEMERDVSKYWKQGNVRIALYGLENQTKVESHMPFRVIGYDGSAYRARLLEKKEMIVPVVTLVLYFGTETRWSKPKNIKSLLDIPEWLDLYVEDYRINVFEIAWLSEEELNRFHSDFRIIARFFVEKRRNPEYIPNDPMEIEHVDEFLKLMAVLTGDNRYIDIVKLEGKEIVSMCDVATRLENIGIQKGLAEGERKGLAEGVRKGLAEGELKRLIKQTCKKMQKSLSAEEIADDLAEDDIVLIRRIMDAVKESVPEYDIDAIYKKVIR